MFRFAVLGTGRIGDMHAKIIHSLSDAEVTWCYDIDVDRAKKTAESVSARYTNDISKIFKSNNFDAVLIASLTNTHVELILKSAEYGKPILCEKPIDVDINKVEQCKKELLKFDVPIHIGFNRRFDPSHKYVKDSVHRGEIGDLELLVITSRDPGPPPPRPILEACGGLFRDTTIHDFDMARFILKEEPSEIFAMASNLVDPIFAELNDYDTSMVIMKTKSGAMCHINNSRRTNYGYDQRVEAFGKGGMVQSNNLRPKEVSIFNDKATDQQDLLLWFFIERYKEAYQAEIEDFIKNIKNNDKPSVTFEDGRRALILANAAYQSLEAGKAIKVEY